MMMPFQSIWLDDKSELLYAPHFLGEDEASHYFQQLEEELDWHREKIKIFGKEYWQPRLLAWYGDPEARYSYSGIAHEPLPWHPLLLDLKEKIEASIQDHFNSVLANLYRDGQDSMGWHSDNEPELGNQPVIASLSLGGRRRFAFRPRKSFEGKRQSFDLGHGSLLIMKGQTQARWQHQIAKTKKQVHPRINLTFRQIIV
jgi:alkylated DNA repair dioxygenase AlkB